MKLKPLFDVAGKWLPLLSGILPKDKLKAGFYYEGFLSRSKDEPLVETIARWDGSNFWYWIDANTSSISHSISNDQLGFSPVNEIEAEVSRYLPDIPMEKVKHE